MQVSERRDLGGVERFNGLRGGRKQLCHGVDHVRYSVANGKRNFFNSSTNLSKYN